MPFTLLDTDTNFKNQLNDWGRQGIPFIFIVDYAKTKPQAWKISDIDPGQIAYNFNGFTNQITNKERHISGDFSFTKEPISFEKYRKRFQIVLNHLKAGNSFLVNLSVPTPIHTNLGLDEIFQRASAPYRLRFRDEWVCFSPEIFITISGKDIASFPMKGTIDASLTDAARTILNDPKEAAEHATIVDLIRNDLSMVCEQVWVERYRYLERIHTHQKTLLQVSSKIRGTLSASYLDRLGDLLWELLPAGSITGAPKPRTLDIIAEAEAYDRGYYTGIMGYFDGQRMESAVMIRFIEKQDSGMIFKSGGGITARSTAENEYQEIIDKVYLPFQNHESNPS
ncbi:aminodeoxychorismate synthase component I [Dyadobacter tibetensis]|uniref:aminodeoxychorismate synthase component I n=1 Tax=Dyadobacter tibetensis TaxID=1211851 RepID=UPI0004B00AA8|nr:aminodeoxychorismate synthase component I [Dyadobacter tibetensis]